jgi:hypothetical protein
VPIQVFPLTGGLAQNIDRRLLPDGVLADAVNCELERTGRIVGRAKYTSLGTGVLDTSGPGALVAYDLFTYQGRLFALGDDTRLGVPANLFEYLGSGVAAAWRPTSTLAAVPRLPQATRVRDISRPPDQPSGAASPTAAALGGFTALAWNSASVSSDAFLLVSRAASDQPIHFSKLSTTSDRPCRNLRLVALSDRFMIVGTATNESKVGLASFIPASDTSVTQLAQDVIPAISANVLSIAACKVTGTDEIVVATGDLSGNTRIARFSNAGVDSGVTYGPIATGATQISVEASSTANEITVAQVVGGECRLFTFNLTTGAQIGVGPFVPFSGDTSTEVSLARISSTRLAIASSIASGTTPSIKVSQYTTATNAMTAAIVLMTDAQLCTGIASIPVFTGLLFGARHTVSPNTGTFTNLLMSGRLDIESNGCIEIAKDFETAGATGNQLRPELVQDASTGKWYWCNVAADPDLLLFPQLTEFSFGATERRQSAEIAGHLYIAGGCPLVFDGSSAVECGFQTRPRIVSLTDSNGAGTLLNSGEYDYRVHWSWVDAKGDLHLSPPSLISTDTLGASSDTETVVVSSPISRRRNSSAPPSSAVNHVLSRTLATADLEPAVIIGATSINPPSSSLNGLTLKLTAGGSSFTVTFSGSATTQATVLSEINAVVSSEVTATAPNGVLVLTSVDTGDGATLQITNGTANTILGLTEGDTETGTTERSKGENFQRSASAYNAITDAVAAYVTITDFRHDQSDPIVDSDLIRQQVLYSQGIASGAHHAPPPSDYVWASRDRLLVAGQPKRSRFTASKTIVPVEPAEFAFEGFLQYSGQVREDIEAIATLGNAIVVFTRRSIWLITGEGPNRSGVGEFNAPQCLTQTLGLIADGWRSLCEDDEGIWFQGSDTEIYRVSRGGEIEWLGKPVRDYVESYPVVVAAVYRQKKREVAFAVTNSAGSTGGILRRNARVPDAPAWFFDDVGAVASMAEYLGRLAYIQAGVVYLQDAAPGSGAFPTVKLDSAMFQGFQGLGYGNLQELGVLATFRGRCTITLKLGTDGVSYPTTLGSWSLTSSEYAVNQRVQLLIDAPTMDFDSFSIRAEMSDVAGDTEGAWLHAFAVKTESSPDFVRLAPSRRL